jgi:hypothetical protein
MSSARLQNERLTLAATRTSQSRVRRPIYSPRFAAFCLNETYELAPPGQSSSRALFARHEYRLRLAPVATRRIQRGRDQLPLLLERELVELPESVRVRASPLEVDHGQGARLRVELGHERDDAADLAAEGQGKVTRRTRGLAGRPARRSTYFVTVMTRMSTSVGLYVQENDEPSDHDLETRMIRLPRGSNWTLVKWTLVGDAEGLSLLQAPAGWWSDWGVAPAGGRVRGPLAVL